MNKKIILLAVVGLLLIIGAVVVRVFFLRVRVESISRIDQYLLEPTSRVTVVGEDGTGRIVDGKSLILTLSASLAADSGSRDVFVQSLMAKSLIKVVGDYWELSFNEIVNLTELKNQLLGYAGVTAVEYNDVLVSLYQPNDYALIGLKAGENPYWLEAIGAKEAWDKTRGSAGVWIGVVDTPVDVSHPDLVGQVSTNLPNEIGQVHGTHVAGTIAAATDNAKGIAAIGFQSKIRHLSTGTTIAALAGAVAQLADSGVRIINISMGTTVPSAILQEAVRYANQDKDVLIVVAAGNCGDIESGKRVQFGSNPCIDPTTYDAVTNEVTTLNNATFYPAAYSGVLSVGAVGKDGARASFSNWNKLGAGYVAVMAPGENIVSTVPGGGYATMSGTSMAAPIVSGIAALVVAADPEITAAQLFETLTQSATFLAGESNFGVVNAKGALDMTAGEPEDALPSRPTPTIASTPTPADGPLDIPDIGASVLASQSSSACLLPEWVCNGYDQPRHPARCEYVWQKVWVTPGPPLPTLPVAPGCGRGACYTVCASCSAGGTISLTAQWDGGAGCLCGDHADMHVNIDGGFIGNNCPHVLADWHPNDSCAWPNGFLPGNHVVVVGGPGSKSVPLDASMAAACQAQVESPVAVGVTCPR